MATLSQETWSRPRIAVVFICLAVFIATVVSGFCGHTGAVTGLPGTWTYEYDGQRGKAEIQQDHDNVIILGTWLPDEIAGRSGPHTRVIAKLNGRMLEGRWFCKKYPLASCKTEGFKFHAVIEADPNNKATRIVVSRDLSTSDVPGYNWHGRTFVPAASTVTHQSNKGVSHVDLL